jgi:hypothetical protein
MFKDHMDAFIEGHVKVWDPESGQIYLNKRNAINFENISIAIANTLAGKDYFFISEMHFGNGGTVIDGLGNITYRAPNVNGQAEDLYNPTFYKVVDPDDLANNTDVSQNKTQVSHTNGLNYSDIIITCTLDYAEPSASDTVFNLAGSAQSALDNAANMDDDFVFDELGLKVKGATGLNTGLLISHLTFHPIQKSQNRLIQVVYTLRIRAG